MNRLPVLALLLSTLLAGTPPAQGADGAVPEAYLQRVADNYRAAMASQDYDKDGVVTRAEARIDLRLSGAFRDIDIDGDGRITPREMERFIAALPQHPEWR
jgi:hypothetical protein